MLYGLGRFLQLVGLFVVPAAIMGNVLDKITVPDMLKVAGFGMLVFFAGWTIQQGGKK